MRAAVCDINQSVFFPKQTARWNVYPNKEKFPARLNWYKLHAKIFNLQLIAALCACLPRLAKSTNLHDEYIKMFLGGDSRE